MRHPSRVRSLGALVLIAATVLVTGPAGGAGVIVDGPPRVVVGTPAAPEAGHRLPVRLRIANSGGPVPSDGRIVVVVRRVHVDAPTASFRRPWLGERVTVRTPRLAAGRYVGRVDYRPAAGSGWRAMTSSFAVRVRR